MAHLVRAGVLLVSVECAMECRMRVNDVFLRCAAFGGNASLSLADPCLAHVLKHPTAACPRSAIHGGQKVLTALRYWQELDAERVVS